MLVFVDYEHSSGHGDDRDDERSDRMRAGRTRITYRLEDLAATHCHLVRYDRIDQQLLDRLGTTAIFISGNSVGPGDYDGETLETIHSIIRTTDLPIFGFCGGFQLIAQALGAPTVPLPSRDGADNDPMLVTTPSGRTFEYGYHPVDIVGDHRILDGVGPRPVMRHAHGFHVPEPPDGFVNLASTVSTPVQLAVHDERRIVGAQFHPEYWTTEHPAGRALIANFLSWSGLAAT